MATKLGLRNAGVKTEFIYSALNSQRTRGTIVAHLDAGVNTSADLPNAARSIFPDTFPGDPDLTPLRYARVIPLKGGKALGIGYYGAGGANRFVKVLNIRAGTRTFTSYTYPELEGVADADIPEHYLDERRFLKPRQIEVPVSTITWADVRYSDVRPTLHLDIYGKLNENSYTIDGYTFSRGQLRFEGEDLTHERWGGVDRYSLTFEATFDPLAWRDETLTGDAPGTPTMVDVRPATDYVTFPDLP